MTNTLNFTIKLVASLGYPRTYTWIMMSVCSRSGLALVKNPQPVVVEHLSPLLTKD